MFEIQDLKRDDASQDDIIGIEECYEETTFEERKQTANFDNSEFTESGGKMQPIGAHLNMLRQHDDR